MNELLACRGERDRIEVQMPGDGGVGVEAQAVDIGDGDQEEVQDPRGGLARGRWPWRTRGWPTQLKLGGIWRRQSGRRGCLWIMGDGSGPGTGRDGRNQTQNVPTAK
ncbi:MAG TPA: hypothetical protein DCE44_07855 [Verrucomicrobiales bacterium]|nr:hypothetical protein [Verrucomicrobiales bacterium]